MRGGIILTFIYEGTMFYLHRTLTNNFFKHTKQITGRIIKILSE